MSDYIQYTQWRQQEERLSRELEQRRAIVERLAADRVEASARADLRVDAPQPQPLTATGTVERKATQGASVRQESDLREQELVTQR